MQKKFQEVTHEIESSILDRCINFSAKTEMYVRRLFDQFGFDQVFGRSAVMEALDIKTSAASNLISKLYGADIIERVSGHGKGKYKFKR